MITCFTHRYSESGDCMDCGVALAEYLQGDTLRTHKLTMGCHIGLIYSPTTGFTAYIAGEHDSNKRCTEVDVDAITGTADDFHPLADPIRVGPSWVTCGKCGEEYNTSSIHECP